MAAPTFVQATGGAADASGAWGFTLSFPGAMTIGNLVILQIVQDGATAGAVTYTSSSTAVENLAGTQSTLTQIGGEFAIGSPTDGLQQLLVGRARVANNQITAIGANSTSEDVYVRAYEFAGVNAGTTVNDIIENTTAGNAVGGFGTSTTLADTGVTTTGADRLALNFTALVDDLSLDAFTGESGGDWTEAVEEYAEASGTDAALGLQIATIASAGTINGGTDTLSGSIGWGAVGFALIPASSFATHTGSAAIPLTLARQVAGFATKAGLSAVPLSASIATKGFKTTASGISVPLSLSIATAGARTISGSASVPLSVSVSTAGTATHLASAAVPLSLSIATAGFKTTTSSAAVPLTLNRQVAGFKTTASSAAVPLVIGIDTAGDIQGNVTGSASVPLVFGVATAGFKGTTSSLAVPLALAIGTAGFRTTTSSLAVPLVIGIATAGAVEADGGDSPPFRSMLGVGI